MNNEVQAQAEQLSGQQSRNVQIQPEQVNVLIHYMSTHSEFAANRLLGCNGKENKKRQWERVAEQVSSCGPVKDSKQVKSVWDSLRKKAKTYNACKVKQHAKTGNEAEDFIVDPQMEKVLAVVGKSHCNGLNIVPEVGAKPLSTATPKVTYTGGKKKKKKNLQKNRVVYEFPDLMTTKVKVEPQIQNGAPATGAIVRPSSSVVTTFKTEPTLISTASTSKTSMEGSGVVGVLTRRKAQQEKITITPTVTSTTNSPAAASSMQPKSNAINNASCTSENQEYSKIYANYASLWRNKNDTSNARKQLALRAIENDSNNAKQLIESVNDIKETEAKKLLILEKYCSIVGKYYEEKTKVLLTSKK